MMLRKTLFCVAAGLSLALAGCGGGSSGGANVSGGASAATVAGPLDPLQSTLTTSVFNPLESATAGTPLAGTLTCADAAVNGNLLDTVDALINGLQSPTSLVSTTPAQIQGQLMALAGNLQSLITSLANQGACVGGSAGAGGTNPLAGTPLSALGDLLPQLQTLQSQLSGGQMSLASLSALFSQLQTALQSALGQLPSSATTAPVVGGLLTALPTALGDIANVINTLTSNPANAPAVVATTVQDIVTALTTQIVPLADLQTLSGATGSGTPLTQVQTTIQSLVTQLQSALSGGGSTALNPTQLTTLLAPVQSLVQQLVSQLPSGLSSGSSGNPVTDLLNTLLPSVQTVLSGLLSGGTSGSTCVLSGLPLLSILCP